ncbi:peptidoglycan editing factor PgeF [Simiduia sp. 21SJ11W-1]|uniref:peptidoglycan editing factor PgeF n=1 Tax=Simiduia sp. 21SJ11W-1 TaxID=2909669 RepID=UPI00209EBCA2|nr:peptidoglycan editing factor PgeF [Simiduia sp. 21SJ11W-1]UTA48847.1 peptidoglycan editing factor PgeF [Simiduia sp. 21SJ11W-1]
MANNVPPITLVTPDWPLPENVGAAITTRAGGVSSGPYAGANMALHVDDEPANVAANRAQLMQQLGLEHIQWLEQIHGTDVIDAEVDGLTRTADGCLTDRPGLACAVLTADCLPILLCERNGAQVGALHAGWRGLAKGIVARAVTRFDAPARQLMAYLGPAIGPSQFEVGVEVLEAFFELANTQASADAVAAAFTPAQKPLKFHADLYQLATLALKQAGVHAVYGGNYCTASDPERFYSYRRAAVTGRMASLIWRKK